MVQKIMKAKVDVGTIKIDIDSIRLTEHETVEDFVKKVESGCHSVIERISLLRQKTDNKELEFIDIELYEILNYIEKL